ncbi:MAG: sulfotransferase [Steroidobacteraceae bacterium]|jgi:tetratricopeptide (TPR) repeat protein
MSTPDLDTLARLAAEDLQKDHVAAAEAKCLRALGIDREHENSLTVLGMVLQAQGRHDDAIRVFNSLTLKQPSSARHWENLGIAYRGARRYDAALSAFARVLALGPGSAVMLYNLGLVHAELLDLPSAHEVLSQARVLAPRDAWTCIAFARCSYDLGDFESARHALEGWQELESLTPEALAEIAYLLTLMGQVSAAQPAIESLASQAPLGRAALTQANVLERLNRLPEARSALQRARFGSGVSGSDPDLLLAGAVLAQRESNHAEARDLLTQALKDHQTFSLRHNLLFPLAASLDALGDYEGAFAAMGEAHRSQVEYLAAALGRSPDAESPTMQLTQRGVEPDEAKDWIDEWAPAKEQSPVFVVGFPRSGTTLLEVALDAHPALKSMDEQPFLARTIDQMRTLELDYPADLGKLTSDQLTLLRSQYWKRVDAQVSLDAGQRLVDKNPLNLLRLPLIRRLFPNARTVLITRHPCDVIMSCFIQHFRAPDLAMLCRDLKTLAGSYRRSFDYWYVQQARLGAVTFEIRYETLVKDLETQLRALVGFLDLPWEPAMLSPASRARARGFISTPSYTQVIEPITSQAIGRWRNYEPHLREVLPMLAPYLERWG